MECKICLVAVKIEELLKCVTCHGTFHYGCTGLSDTDFKKILPMNKGKWKCQICKTNKKPTISPTPTQVLQSEESQSHSIINIDMKSIMAHFDVKFNALNAVINSFKSEVNENLTKLSSTVNSWDAKINHIETTLDTVTTTVQGLETANSQLRDEIHILKKQFDDIEQKARSCNIEIQNFPEHKNENLLHLVEVLGTAIGVPIPIDSIRDVHRVAHNQANDRPKNIIVQLTTRRLKTEVIAAARARRGLTVGQLQQAVSGPSQFQQYDASQASRRIFINEHLTLKNKILYAQAREAASVKKYKFVWVKNATILLRKSEGKDIPVVAIKCAEDLKKL